MKKIINGLKTAFEKQIDGTGLAVFRIAYSVVLFCEILQMFYFRHLIFDKIPYIDEAEISFAIPIVIWGISVLFILFGAFTRFFSILNYLMGLVLIGSITTYEYHVFYAYMGINFLLIFLPVSKCLSLDRLLLKLKYSNTTFQYSPSKNVSQLYYYIIPFLGLGLVYFDSVFYKLASPMWVSGLGSWLPSSLPMITHTNTSFLLNNEYLIKFIGWFTIVFEFFFLFLFFKKKWRIILTIIGLILHLGILLQFPIPWFALTAIVIYIFMIPVSFWERIFKSKIKKQEFFFYYDTECPLCIRTKITITHLDWFNKIGFKTVQFDAQDHEKLNKIDSNLLLDDIHSVDANGNIFIGVDTYIQVFKRIFYLYPLYLILNIPGIYHLARNVYSYIAKNRDTERCTEENCGYNPPIIPDNDKIKILHNLTIYDLKAKLVIAFLIITTVLQAGILYNSWTFDYLKEVSNFKNTKADKLISSLVAHYSTMTKIALGITSHPVFSERIHFDNYNHIIELVYLDKRNNNKEIWLPIVDKKGQPNLYIYGSNWVNWTFRVNQQNIDLNVLAKGVERYTSFWAYKNNIDLGNDKFLIKIKKIDSPDGWERDFLNKQIAKPWIDGGYIEWKNGKFISHIKEIEKL